MHYVGLLSGGKDSCFNLLHCAQHGHKLVVAASLGPESGKDEIDSYLYQTVGQDAIQLVADALEVPLLRRVIKGAAVQQGSEYGSRTTLEPLGVQGDETEDLYELLSEVKAQYPEVKGVSVGAILSNYQRVRVENVCQRLSLTPLCYLWQRDQSELLSEMIGAGLEAILIKVAGIGLTTKHLGKTLAQMQPTLLNLNSLYGLHVCGEGGEYESLTLDSPLFKHRIILEEVETVIHSDSAFATVAFLKVTRAHLQKKLDYSIPDHMAATHSILSDGDEAVREAVSRLVPSFVSDVSLTHVETYKYWQIASTNSFSRQIGPWVVIGNVNANNSVHPSIEDEVLQCFEIVRSHLTKHNLNFSHIANIMLLIADMDLFPAVNATYGSFFGISPPARACVAVDLPHPIRVRLECIAYVESQPYERHSLHVQSLSHWAPANIGPYSQAITVGERIFVSGQIGLIPASNILPVPQSLPTETALSLRHVRSICDVVKHSSVELWDGALQGVISWLAHKGDITAVKNGMSTSEHFRSGKAPTLFAVVRSLPKNALVETQVLLHTARRLALDEDEDDGHVKMASRFSRGKLTGVEACWEVSCFKGLDASLAIVACSSNDDEDKIAEGLIGIMELLNVCRNALCVRLLHTPSAAPDLRKLFGRLFGDVLPHITPIPCRALATWEKDDWDYAVCIVA